MCWRSCLPVMGVHAAVGGGVSGWRAPGRDRRRVAGRGGAHLAAHLLQAGDNGVQAVDDARPPGPGSRPPCSIVTGADRHLRVRGARHDRRAAEAGEQRGRARGGAQRQLAVGAALEPVGRLGVQPVTAGHLRRRRCR